MTHYAYKTTFDTGEYYIGVRKLPGNKTIRTDVYWGSGKALKRALRTAVPKKQVLAQHLTKHEAYLLESKLVNYETLLDPKCLNLVLGGRGGYLDTVPLCKRWQRDKEKLKTAVAKTAEKRRGKTKDTDLGLKRMSAALSGRTKHTHAYIAQISDKLRGRTKQTSDALARMAKKISILHRGKNKNNSEYRKKQSSSISGIKNPSYRKNIEHSSLLQSIDAAKIPGFIFMKRHSRETQLHVISLAKVGILRVDISKQTGIPESTVNAWISKVISTCCA